MQLSPMRTSYINVVHHKKKKQEFNIGTILLLECSSYMDFTSFKMLSKFFDVWFYETLSYLDLMNNHHIQGTEFSITTKKCPHVTPS